VPYLSTRPLGRVVRMAHIDTRAHIDYIPPSSIFILLHNTQFRRVIINYTKDFDIIWSGLVPRDVLALACARRSAPALPASLTHRSPVALYFFVDVCFCFVVFSACASRCARFGRCSSLCSCAPCQSRTPLASRYYYCTDARRSFAQPATSSHYSLGGVVHSSRAILSHFVNNLFVRFFFLVCYSLFVFPPPSS